MTAAAAPHPRLAAPMAIAPGWREPFAAAWQRWVASDRARRDRPRADIYGGTSSDPSPILRLVDDVALVSISGPLTNDSSEWGEFLCEIFGGTTYASIWRALEQAQSRARAILCRFDTPGGDADGVGELGRYIASVAARMPVWSHVGAQCCSAGVWLASQTSRLDAVPEATVGSIGVRCTVYDYSKLYETIGIREIELVAEVGPNKRFKPIDDEVIARVQRNIDDLGELFVAAVAKGRGVDADKVTSDFGKGDVMLAARAVDVGLVDNVSDFNATLAALKSASAGRPRSGGASARRKVYAPHPARETN